MVDREARGVVGEFPKKEVTNDEWQMLKPKTF
jgi:hypothetical protein